MSGDYRKFNIEMKREISGYRLWKRGMDNAACIIESYKDKRSVYFAVSNLLPSAVLLQEENKEYHLILLGASEGEVIHKDFGTFFVNTRGEGSFFKKFTGPAVECYTHCLLVVLDKTSGKTQTLLSGSTPFFQRQRANPECEEQEPCQEEEASIKPLAFGEVWQVFFDDFDENAADIFAPERDETGAVWCRVSRSSPLPKPLLPCRDLITTYGHYLIGRKEDRCFAAVPGRFLRKEQPCREEGCFSLWQPIRGGEKYFDTPENMSDQMQEEIFGYWIGEIDRETGEIAAI